MARARSPNLLCYAFLLLALTYLVSGQLLFNRPLFKRHGVGGDDDDEEGLPAISSAVAPAFSTTMAPGAKPSNMNAMGSACNSIAPMQHRKRHGVGGDDDDEEEGMPAAPTAAAPVVPSNSNGAVPSGMAGSSNDCGGGTQAAMPKMKKPTGMHGTVKLRRDAHIAHGVVMCLALCLFFPMGAILLRTIDGPKAVKIHYMWQTMGLVVMLVGFALGIWMSWLHNEMFTEAHETYGIVLVAFFLIQPIVGILHHMHFKKHGTTSTLASFHVWFGRILIIMAVINGGLGLQVSGNVDLGGYITYSIEIVLIAIAYIGVVGVYYRKKRRAALAGHGEVVRAPGGGMQQNFAGHDSSLSDHGAHTKEYGPNGRQV